MDLSLPSSVLMCVVNEVVALCLLLVGVSTRSACCKRRGLESGIFMHSAGEHERTLVQLYVRWLLLGALVLLRSLPGAKRIRKPFCVQAPSTQETVSALSAACAYYG